MRHNHIPVIRDIGGEDGWRIVCERCGLMLDFRSLRGLLEASSLPNFTTADWEVAPYEAPEEVAV